MLDAEKYVKDLTRLLLENFKSRLVYVGLQGSYLRNEATENSDIDVMVVIDGLTVADLDRYRELIAYVGAPEKSCGFICSEADLAAWNPLEVCNLLHSTKDYYGVLEKLVPACTKEDVRNFAKLSLNNLYHEICHGYIHSSNDRNIIKLTGSYKSVFFILQTVEYLRTGNFINTKKELLESLSGRDKMVLQMAMQMPEGVSFTDAFTQLFIWCQETLSSLV